MPVPVARYQRPALLLLVAVVHPDHRHPLVVVAVLRSVAWLDCCLAEDRTDRRAELTV